MMLAIGVGTSLSEVEEDDASAAAASSGSSIGSPAGEDGEDGGGSWNRSSSRELLTGSAHGIEFIALLLEEFKSSKSSLGLHTKKDGL